ncbi:MAG: cyclase family protein [Chloroflexi bacterium]|nr:cyclase family protein [Chloroflexota bacterium]
MQTGETVSCARPITTDMAPDISHQVQRFMVDSGEGRDTDPLERRNSRRGAAEFIGMVFHGQTITHIDALSHYSHDGLMYNGVPAAVVTAREGAQSHAIDLTAQGLVSRGVLLDIPKIRGVDWLPPDAPVVPEDLDAAERDHGLTVESGDILLVRTGNYRRRLVEGPLPPTEPSVACHVACAPWFKERGIAMLGTDTSNDIRPNEYPNIVSPLHISCLVYLGVWLIDNANLEEVAEVAARHNRYEFMLSIGALRLRNVTGSPVNPIAIF